MSSGSSPAPQAQATPIFFQAAYPGQTPSYGLNGPNASGVAGFGDPAAASQRAAGALASSDQSKNKSLLGQ